jgi:uncharacterized alpha-E superfamily protein
MQSLRDTHSINQLSHRLDKLYTRLFGFYGNIYETLPRDNGFYLFEAGKNIERIISLISVLRSAFTFKNEEEVEAVILEAVLENHHLLTQYRHIYKSQWSLVAGLDMVLLEKNLPYTLSYLLDQLGQNLAKLPKSVHATRLGIDEKIVLEATTIVKLIDTESLVQVDDETQYRSELDKTLEKVSDLISKVTGSLSSLYFSHSVIQHSLLDTIEKINSDEI